MSAHQRHQALRLHQFLPITCLALLTAECQVIAHRLYSLIQDTERLRATRLLVLQSRLAIKPTAQDQLNISQIRDRAAEGRPSIIQIHTTRCLLRRTNSTSRRRRHHHQTSSSRSSSISMVTHSQAQHITVNKHPNSRHRFQLAGSHRLHHLVRRRHRTLATSIGLALSTLRIRAGHNNSLHSRMIRGLDSMHGNETAKLLLKPRSRVSTDIAWR